MKEEPEIVKQLREKEKLGVLESSSKNVYEKLEIMSEQSVKETGKMGLVEDAPSKNIGEIYKTVFDNSAIAVTVTDENERIILWNQYAEKLLGKTKDDLYMQPIESLYPPDEWKKIRSENIREKGMKHHLETKILRKNNEPLDVDMSLSVIKDNNGNITGSIGVIKDISEQKRVEQRLISLMKYTDDSVYLVDRECRYIFVNNELLSRLDLSMEQVVGKTFNTFHTPEETKEFVEKVDQIFKNGKPLKGEHKNQRLGQWFLRTLSPVKDSITGQTTAVAVISKDITDWKNIQEKVEESEKKYRTIFENSAVAIMLTDENEKIISWNKYTENLLDMNKEDLYMKPVESLYPPDEWKKIRSENIREKGMKHHLETKILRKNNEPLDVDISLSVIKDNNGNITGSIGIIRDIAQRKKMEFDLQRVHNNLEQRVKKRTADLSKTNEILKLEIAERKKAEEDLKIKDNAIASSINGIAIADLDGNLTYVNQSFLNMWGYDNYKEVAEKSIVSFWHKKGKAMSILDKVVEKKGWLGELIAERIDGATFDVQISLSIVSDELEKPLCIMASFVDITEQKKAEERLQKSQKRIEQQNIELRKLDKLKSEFLNITSHELRTPMASIKGYVQMMLKQTLGGVTDEQKKSLNVVLRNADRLDNLIQDILDISRLESGTMRFILEKTNLQKMLNEITETMQSSADLKNIKIYTNIGSEMPELLVDTDRLKQVVINLVNNAIKFSPDDSIINIHAKKEKDDILFEVQDFGRGIPKDKQKRVFETFYQVDGGMDRKFGGVGLGLAISRGIVLAHGGNIWVEGQVGKGSIFRFTLPVKPVLDVEKKFKEADVFGLGINK